MIGQRIRLARQNRSLTQAEVSQRLGVSQQTLARWESGEKRISAPTMCLLADAMTTPVADIIDVIGAEE